MVGHRYNLRPASAKETRQRPRASRASTLPKRRPASTTTATPTTTAPSADTSLLYQPPQKWTLAHLRVTNLQHETDVPWEQIVDARYTPSDCDSEFQRMSACLQDPVLEEPDAFSYGYDMRKPRTIFEGFFYCVSRFNLTGHLFNTLEAVDLISIICRQIRPDRSLIMKAPSRLPLSISALKAGKGIWVDGSMLSYSKEDKTMGMPLAVVSRKQETGDLGMAKYEIPQLLLQANMAFNYDKSFEEYEAFMISIEGYTYTFIRAIMSPQYLKSLRAGQPANGPLKVLRSKPFNVIDRGERMEFLRRLMALDRYLVQRPEFSFPMRKYRVMG